MKTLYKYLIASTLLSYAYQANATTSVNGLYTWTFGSGQAWPNGYNTSSGKPNNIINASGEYSSELYNRINLSLPESRVNEAYLTDDLGSNIYLSQGADVYLTFLHEGAGYLNSVGYFIYDRNNPPTRKEDIREVIMFPNLSFPYLATGNRLYLGHFNAGTSIGFVLVANGFSSSTGVKTGYSPIYYSLKNLNPETNSTLRQHMVLLQDSSTSQVILGMEDLNRATGDNDFNDAVFAIKSTPDTAIETISLNKLAVVNDSDKDGVPDSLDQFPSDPYASQSSYYPSQGSWVTYAFEDNWPNKGDYDFNDLVVRENTQIIKNSAGAVTSIVLNGFIDARGASYQNGFGLSLIGQSKTNIKNISMSLNGQVVTRTLEDGQTLPVIKLWDNTNTLTTTGETGSCSHFNTVKTCAHFNSIPYSLTISFKNGLPSFSQSQLDFFLFRSDYRAREVHLPDYAPTDKFDKTQFGKFDDTSVANSGRYFRTQNNLPWAITIPGQWRHPREYIDITWAYPDFEKWVESSGSQNSNWYATSTKVNHYY